MTPGRAALILIAAIGVLYLVTVLSSPLDAFWTIDGGFKFLTVQQLAATSFRDVSIPYPGETIDPEGDFFPVKPPMATRRQERFYPDVSLVFPILTTPLYSAFSWLGLYLLPIVATLVTLWFAYRLAEPGAGPWALITIPIVGLATPVFFYALTFWEHNLAVLLTTAAVYLLVRSESRIGARTALLAGALMGMAVWFREECYLFAGSVVVTLIVTRRGVRATLATLAGCALAVVPLWIFQWRVLGKAFGGRIGGASQYGLLRSDAGEGLGGYLTERVETLYAWTLGLHADWTVTLGASVPLLACAVLFWILRTRREGLAVAWAGSALYAIVCLLVLGSLDERVFSTYFAGGLFATGPVLAALLAGVLSAHAGPRARRDNFLGLVVLIFFSAAVILSPAKYQRGIHWGARYLLPVVPLLAAVGLSGARRALERTSPRTLPLALGMLVLALSFVVQTHGIAALATKKRGTARTLAAFREKTREDVVTNEWWVPLEVAAAFRERRIYLVIDTADFHRLLGRLGAAAIHRFTLVVSPTMDQVLQDPAISVHAVEPLVQPAMRYFDLWFCDCGPAEPRPPGQDDSR